VSHGFPAEDVDWDCSVGLAVEVGGLNDTIGLLVECGLNVGLLG